MCEAAAPRILTLLFQTKNEYASEDAVTDDAAGQAYVEQFAQETLDRAQRVVKANKVTAYGWITNLLLSSRWHKFG